MNDLELENKMDELQVAIKNDGKRIGVWDNHETYHKACTSEVSVDGLWLEFGVYRGRTITTIAKETSSMVYGFDSFEGLPEKWDDDNPKGVYGLNGSIPLAAITGENDDNPGMYDPRPTITTEPWQDNIVLIKGWFEETLPFFLKEHKEKAAFVHIDSDVYSSAQTVLSLLKEGDRFQDGTILLFDEIIDYPTYREHEIKAFAEFLLETNYKYECLYHQSLGDYSQACFKILKR